MILEYTIPSHMDPDDKYEFESNSIFDGGKAVDAAENFWDNHDGWECSWPLDFVIYQDGEEKGTFSVEVESSPTFSAIQK